jgi:long-subunit fatty acid transport protein
MQGRQYYFGFQFGSAYKLNDNLAVYGGLRILYGTATYKAKISNIMVKLANDQYVDFGSFLEGAATTVDA